MTPATQRAILDALKAAALKLCAHCRMGWPIWPDGLHRYRSNLYAHPCESAAERALIEQAEKEMGTVQP
jgi:hypothetical protein